MGVRRSETRLLLGYLEARMEIMDLREQALDGKVFKGEVEEINMAGIQARKGELTRLIDMFGGYRD